MSASDPSNAAAGSSDSSEGETGSSAAPPTESTGRPVPRGQATGGNWHEIAQGESIFTLAHRSGHLPDRIWNHSANDRLREKRSHPGILLPGDWVFVPNIEAKDETVETERRHSFHAKHLKPRTLKLRIIPGRTPIDRNTAPEGKPIRYTLWVGDRMLTGQTSPGETIEVSNVPPDMQDAKLLIDGRTIRLKIGHLDPKESPSGIGQRLRSLGYGSNDKALDLFKARNDFAEERSEAKIRDQLDRLHTGD